MADFAGSNPACPACSCPTAGGDLPFFRQARVPVQSCQLFTDAEAASRVDRRDIDLRACGVCGLIYNRDFDPASQAFSPSYEETQGFSPRFRRFCDSLIDSLDRRWGLQRLSVVEIGCGKGEFLDLLCARTGCRGLGIDPAFDPARRPQGAPAAVSFEQRLFSSCDIGRLRADYLLCRHTLEHIGPVHAFLDEIRRACTAGGIGEVFIEVPDAKRILKEGAFWDIYYEHANYFDEASLVSAMQRAGFEVDAVERLFHDQYLGVFARPGPAADARTPIAKAHSVDQLGDSLARWRQRLLSMAGPVVIWGSGSKGVSFISQADCDQRIVAAVDINPFRHDRYLPGSATPIVAPEALIELGPAHIIVMNPAYLGEITRAVQALGLSAEISAL
ncbi:MAG: class I SAM-dependent methyltransferase [Wenzhouxiangella sp.]|nr:class I SAM-dependent methyltransferase [Wenzhouxiangella sp.]